MSEFESRGPDPIGDLEAALPKYLEQARTLSFHGIDTETISDALTTSIDRQVYGTYLALKSLGSSSSSEVLRLARDEGKSNRFGDTALVALTDFIERWPAIKARLEELEVKL